MSKARILRPCKNAMQSGLANTHKWTLTFIPKNARFIDPLMGWTGSSDMLQQVTLNFDTEESAIAYANKHGIEFDLIEPHSRSIQPKSYSDNFKFTRVQAYSLPQKKA